MAHFAEINADNIVTQVIVVMNEVILDANGVESESIGIQFCKSLCGEKTNWVQTSYNANFRKNFAGIGYTYDQSRDAFIEPKPYPSWILDEATCKWTTPIPYPADGLTYKWDEPTVSWVRSYTAEEAQRATEQYLAEIAAASSGA